MDSNDGNDGVSAPDVLCGRPVVPLANTSIHACSYRRDKDTSPGGSSRRVDGRMEKVPTIYAPDSCAISTTADDGMTVEVPSVVDIPADNLRIINGTMSNVPVLSGVIGRVCNSSGHAVNVQIGMHDSEVDDVTSLVPGQVVRDVLVADGMQGIEVDAVLVPTIQRDHESVRALSLSKVDMQRGVLVHPHSDLSSVYSAIVIKDLCGSERSSSIEVGAGVSVDVGVNQHSIEVGVFQSSTDGGVGRRSNIDRGDCQSSVECGVSHS